MATTSTDPSVRETSSLIASDKVEGTPVYRSNGDKIGRIERVMLEKHGGRTAFSVMSFGGFLGIGNDYYPVPWQLLKYNERLGGYEVNISDQQLKNAPKFPSDDEDYNLDRARETEVFDYYGVTPYW
jgi:hypothetical protein